MAAKKSVSLHQSGQAKQAVANPTTTDRVSVIHGSYLIVAGRRNDACAAVGYLGNRRIEARTADSVDAAVTAVKGALDQRVSGLKAARDGEVPTEDEYREALAALYGKLAKRMRAMLATHCRLPGSAASLADMARRFEITEATAKLDYGKLARQVTKLLDFAPLDSNVDRTMTPLLSLATLTFSEGKRPVLHLRPEFVGALRAMQQVEA